MEGDYILKPLLRQGDCLAKVDLTDAFFSVPIHHQHKKFLRFNFKGKTYQFRCLPFGLSSTPWVFTRTLKPALAVVREKGVRLIAYTDNILILAEYRDLIQDQLTGTHIVPPAMPRIHCKQKNPSSHNGIFWVCQSIPW